MNQKTVLAVVVFILMGGLLNASAQTPETQPEEPKAEKEDDPERLILPAGTQIPLVLQNTVNTRNASKGDRIYFETTFPIVHNGKVIIPVGSYIRGTVTQAKRPGRIKGRAQIHLRFDDLTLPNGYVVNLSASLANAGTQGGEEVDRTEGGIKGEGAKGKDAGTILTTTTAGAVVGAGATGTRGGLQGGTLTGAAIGLATVLFTRGKELVLPRGTTVEISLDRPLSLDPALAKFDWTDYSSGRRNR